VSRLEWVVLAKGKADEIEQTVLGLYQAENVNPAFGVVPGRGEWHVVYGKGYGHLGVEMGLAEALVEQGYDLVYAMGLIVDEPYVFAYKADKSSDCLDIDPDRLAESLGCVIPYEASPQPERPLLDMRSVTRLEGISVDDAQAAYIESFEDSSPPALHFEEAPGGVIVHDDLGHAAFAAIMISEMRPLITAYYVIASPQLDPFIVRIFHGGRSIGHFDVPPLEDREVPTIHEVKGERAPAAILKALGIRDEHVHREVQE